MSVFESSACQRVGTPVGKFVVFEIRRYLLKINFIFVRTLTLVDMITGYMCYRE